MGFLDFFKKKQNIFAEVRPNYWERKEFKPILRICAGDIEFQISWDQEFIPLKNIPKEESETFVIPAILFCFEIMKRDFNLQFPRFKVNIKALIYFRIWMEMK